MTHPLCVFPDNKTAAAGMKAGDKIMCRRSRREGIADEFLPDGEVLCSWNDGTFSTESWNDVQPLSGRVS